MKKRVRVSTRYGVIGFIINLRDLHAGFPDGLQLVLQCDSYGLIIRLRRGVALPSFRRVGVQVVIGIRGDLVLDVFGYYGQPISAESGVFPRFVRDDAALEVDKLVVRFLNVSRQ